MPKSFLQYLKEEEQQGDTLFGYWFRLRSTWGANGGQARCKNDSGSRTNAVHFSSRP